MPLNLGSKIAMLIVLAITLFSPLQTFAQQTAVLSELSTDTITRDESVTLTITAIGLDGELDASSLGEDFEVVGRSSSRQIRTVNSSNNQPVTTSVVTWALELLPKDVGVFTVPSVSVRGQKSQLLTLTVNELPTGAKRDVFVEATVDTQSTWVQSQVTMTLRVYQAIDIVDGGLDVPSGADLVVERIGDEDSRESEVLDGRQYSVTVRRFALFPQKSGTTTIDPITLSVTVPADPAKVRGFFSPTRKITRRTAPITLDVQARPPNGSTWWLPARAVQLERTWSGDPSAAEVDQPLTRSIVLRASGVLESQLPEINIPAIEGLSLYAEQPIQAMGANEAGLVAEQRINWAIIPQRAGELTLPAINVDWFNTQTGKKETAVLPEEIIYVKASTSSTGSPGQAADNVQSNNDSFANSTQADAVNSGISNQAPFVDSLAFTTEGLALPTEAMSDQMAALEKTSNTWRTATIAALALWLATVAFFMIRRLRQPQDNDGLSRSNHQQRLGPVRSKSRSLYSRLSPLAGVESSCKEGDLSSVQRSLLEWSNKQWSDQAPLTLSALAQKLPASDAQALIKQLDAALYSKQDDTSNATVTTTVANLLKELPATLKQAITGTDIDNATDATATKKSLNSLPPL